MTNKIDTWLRSLERTTAQTLRDGQVKTLWPRTLLDSIQTQVNKEYGTTDLKWADPRSRPYKVATFLQGMVAKKLLRSDFTILDLCCGDAMVLNHVARKFPECKAYGTDIAKFDYHKLLVENATVYGVALQDVISFEPPARIDVVMMLNTFRQWEHAGLTKEDAELPEWVEEWLRLYAHRSILTATHRQISSFRNKKWTVTEIGPGEGNSRLICTWPREEV